MAGGKVEVVIYHGADVYMRKSAENDIKPENVPNVARLLMDDVYLRIDDQVSVAHLRKHRRDLREKRLNERIRGGGDGSRIR